ncbi:MAG: tRNA (adenosine(37)-N6)-threonylcarbamoyltransferase complex transferase subunit TsaD [Deltaproteobacteria bacterium]|nr:MAG: tRNA (adenosine(37)-N6)-threonylcarbamoyltransferase complex transferase subunit TsaD [Deltaproteobacteria bacterium]
MIVLGIESSCDETAASVVRDGMSVLSSVVATQIDVHHSFGGVVPELASRQHLEAIVPVVTEALDTAGIGPEGIDGVAVTRGPGLVGALLVGYSFGKAFALSRGIPWIGVDHLAGHLHSIFLGDHPPEYPYVALLASGGHTAIYYVKSPMDVEWMGQTRDDAAGEAYDKVSKMLGLGYPGGRVIDDLAHAAAEKNTVPVVTFPRPFLDKNGFDFSFSGLKSAVSRFISADPHTQPDVAEIARAFQASVVDVLSCKLMHAAAVKSCRHVVLVGGVAANRGLRSRLSEDAEKAGRQFYVPPQHYCGDNAAMIASLGYHYLNAGITSPLLEDVYSRSPLRPPLQC